MRDRRTSSRSDAFAGVERHVAPAGAHAGSRAGHHVTVIGATPAHMAAELGRGTASRRSATGLAALRTVRALCHGRVDVVHVAHDRIRGGRPWARLLGTRRSPCGHTRHFAGVRGSNPRRGVRAPSRSRIDAQIAVSEYVARHIEGRASSSRGVPDRRLSHAVCRPRPCRARRPAPRDGEAHRLSRRRLRPPGLAAPGWTLEVAGGGALEASLDAARRRSGVATQCAGSDTAGTSPN